MRLATFLSDAGPEVAVLAGDGLVPLRDLVPDAPADMLGVVDAGAGLIARVRAALDRGGHRAIPAADVTLVAPIPIPRRNVMCVGKNYHEHAREFEGSGFDSSSRGEAVPEVPIFFTKATTSVIGPKAPIDSSLDPDGSLDYEGELTIVVGRGGRGIPKADALDHVFGYTIINDVTARTTQQRHKQWFLGKSCDTFCPMGPAIVTADEVGDVTALRLETRVNAETRQRALVSDLIFDIPTLIAVVSRAITLQPGDLIATGTPAGVGIGFKPPRYLGPGDVVSVTIEPIGTLTNPVV